MPFLEAILPRKFTTKRKIGAWWSINYVEKTPIFDLESVMKFSKSIWNLSSTKQVAWIEATKKRIYYKSRARHVEQISVFWLTMNEREFLLRVVPQNSPYYPVPTMFLDTIKFQSNLLSRATTRPTARAQNRISPNSSCDNWSKRGRKRTAPLGSQTGRDGHNSLSLKPWNVTHYHNSLAQRTPLTCPDVLGVLVAAGGHRVKIELQVSL
jgi:hypothetical protein